MRRYAGKPAHEHRLPLPRAAFPEHAVADLPAAEPEELHGAIMHGRRKGLNAISA